MKQALIAISLFIFLGVGDVTLESNQWMRSPSNPLFGGLSSSAALEPNVINESGTLKMWYTGGPTGQLNYATSTDGLKWTQYGSNPVLGNGGSGYGGTLASSFVVKFGSTYHVYFRQPSSGDLKHSTSSDGLTWAAPTTILTAAAFAWETQWGNPYVWQEGATWYGLFEYLQPAGGNWQISLFSSSDGLSWSLVNKPLSGLQAVGGGDVGGPFMPYGTQKVNGLYQVWYHGTTNSGVLPTDLYHASSSDLSSWTLADSGSPILTHLGYNPEYDQVADPSLVEFNNQTFIYFTGVNNVSGYNVIQVIVFNGTLQQLIDGAVNYHVGRYQPRAIQ